MSGLLIGYARVSTDEQDLTAQRDALTALGVEPDRIYADHGLTGANRERPGLREALAACRGDVLVVWRLDRLGRSVRHLIETVNSLAERGVGFRSLTEGIDTTTRWASWCSKSSPRSLSSSARSSVSAPMPGSPPPGRVAVRRPTPEDDPSKLATARQLYDGRAHTMEQIAEIVGVSRATLYRHLESAG